MGPFGIVPPAPATSDPNQYQFTLPPPPTPPEEATKVVAGNKHYGIMSRLLGDAERDRVASKQALLKFYADNIHSAYNDPANRTPDEVLVKWGKEMGSLLGHKEAADAINADIQRHISSKAAAKKLTDLNMVQDQSQRGMGVPAVPGPVMPGPGVTPQQPSAPVPGQPSAQSQRPPGLPAPPVPFDNGGQAGGTAPLQNEPIQMRVMAAKSGVGLNIPPRPSVSYPNLAGARISRAALGAEQAAQERPGLVMKSEVERQQMPLNYAARAAMFEGDKDFQELGARGRFMAKSGIPITPDPAPRNIAGLRQGKDLPMGTIDYSGRPVEPQTFYTSKQAYDGTMLHYPATGVTHAITIPDPASSTGFSQVSLDRAQNEVGRQRDVLPNPAFVPQLKEVTLNGVKFVPQADGSYAPVNVQTNTQTMTSRPVPGVPSSGGAAAPAAVPGLPAPPAGTPGAPAASAPPAPRAAAPPLRPTGRPATVGRPGPSVGDRPLTPEQAVKNSQIAEQLNNTIGTIKDIKAKIPMLASLITSGKVALQVDPHQGFWKAIINKNMHLTPEEADLAADWQLLTEGVMQMRIPMGGAGFKGPEGFGAIESNKGIISQHPEIIRRVLEGTLREFQAQRQPLVDAGKKYGYKVLPEYEAGFKRAGEAAMPKQITAPPGSDDLLRQLINEHKKKP